jgi:hypothetical protein
MKLLPSSLLLLVFSTVGVLALPGCAEPAPEEVATGLSAATAGEEPAEEAPVADGERVPAPLVPRLVAVTANGTGCPAGTWSASVAADGSSFRVGLTGMTATVAPGSSFTIKDCQLAIDVEVPAGLQFALSEIGFFAKETLDSDGMSVRQSVKHYFQGDPADGVEHAREVAGPRSNSPWSYGLRDRIAEADAVWSPCGGGRTLNVQTRLFLRNNPEKTGQGTARLSSSWMNRDLGLRWRTCT